MVESLRFLAEICRRREKESSSVFKFVPLKIAQREREEFVFFANGAISNFLEFGSDIKGKAKIVCEKYVAYFYAFFRRILANSEIDSYLFLDSRSKAATAVMIKLFLTGIYNNSSDNNNNNNVHDFTDILQRDYSSAVCCLLYRHTLCSLPDLCICMWWCEVLCTRDSRRDIFHRVSVCVCTNALHECARQIAIMFRLLFSFFLSCVIRIREHYQNYLKSLREMAQRRQCQCYGCK